MQLANQVFYFSAFVVVLGLMLGFLPQYEEYKVNKKTFFWPTSLALYALSMMFFGFAPWLGKSALAIANVSLIWGGFAIALLFRSWRLPLTKVYLLYAGTLSIISAFLYLILLAFSGTVIRIHFMNCFLAMLSAWQIYELLMQVNGKCEFQIKSLFVVEVMQILFRITRSADLLFLANAEPITIYGEAVTGFIFRVGSILLILLKCILITNYFLEIIWRGHKQNSSRIEHGMLRSLNALSMVRDNETGNHILRTQNYVDALACRLKKMGVYGAQLTPSFLRSITKAAPLHDIGKVGIPDDILKKEGGLNSVEWETMQTHANLGAGVLAAAKQEYPFHSEVLDLAIEIAGSHHERWDGSGYPKGLQGESIPLAARIMSLADMYDALVSERAYKSQWSHDEAVKEIVANQGKAFDPLVVEAFLAEQRYFREISEKYED